MPAALAVSDDLRKMLAFGTGVGIEVGATDLDVVVTRVRPTAIRVLGRLVIPEFATRPAAEWGAEYAAFLKPLGAQHLSATVLLPRREVIVRQLGLPGVAPKDIESAVRFQLDSLHPYGEDEVVWGWSRLSYGAVLVGIVRRTVIDRYVELFNAAGIAASSFTFSAAAVHAAMRVHGINGYPKDGFVALSRTAAGAVEVYGESPSRPVYSGEFDMPAERVAAMALSELRLPADSPPLALQQLLPQPAVNPVENDLSRNALPYATALAGACPLLAPSANVLPKEYRRFSSRAMFIPTAALAGLVLVAALGMAGWSKYSEDRYLARLHAEIAAKEPLAQRATSIDREVARVRARTVLLDQYRTRTRRDLDTLNEITRLLEPPSWTNNVDITGDAVRITGEAQQAAPLLKILDSSALFRNSGFDMDQRSPNGSGEVFQIHTTRVNTK